MSRKLIEISMEALGMYAYALQNLRYPKKDIFCPNKAQNGYDKYKEWGYIPFKYPSLICKILSYIKSKYKYKYKPVFLDAGCGMGNIMILAASMGFKVEGIERDKTTFKYAAKLIGMFGKVYNSNMVTFKNYGKYDVIYYYVPIKDPLLMEKCANIIASQMKIGAIIIPMDFTSPFSRYPKAFKFLPSISAYKKINEYKIPTKKI